MPTISSPSSTLPTPVDPLLLQSFVRDEYLKKLKKER
jgi:hypothetical protein